MHLRPFLAEVVEFDPVDDSIQTPNHGTPRPEADGADDLRLITIAAAADRLDLSRSKLYELIAEGELPTVRIGRARRIALADLRAFVDRHRAG